MRVSQNTEEGIGNGPGLDVYITCRRLLAQSLVANKQTSSEAMERWRGEKGIDFRDFFFPGRETPRNGEISESGVKERGQLLIPPVEDKTITTV